MFKKIIFISVLVCAFAATAQAAWYMELTNVDGTLTQGEYYTMNFNLVNDDADLNFNNFYLTIDYDESLVSYAAYMEVEYDDGGVPFPTTIFESPLPETDTGDVVYNILGSEALGHMGEFHPGTGTTPLGTVYFMANTSGTFTDIGVLADGPVSDLIMVELENLMYPGDLGIEKVGDTYRISPVPVPGALLLLGSGLIGLFGIRRRSGGRCS